MLPSRFLFQLCVVFSLACLVSFAGQKGLAQTSDTVVAKVNGRTILLKEVDESILSQVYSLQQQLFAVRRVALDNLITRTILEQAARSRNISLDELKRQLTSGKAEVSAEQVDQFYSDNAAVFGTMSPDEAKERLRLDLEGKARIKLYREAVAELTKQSEIDLRLEEPRVYLGDFSETSSLGPPRAKVTIVEFTDFQCPFCRTAQQTLKRIIAEYGEQVRIVFRNLPLEIHPEAFASAQAAYCAGQQHRFWEFHDALFAAKDLSTDALHQIALQAGLNAAQFSECLQSSASKAAIQADVRMAKQFGFNSTPIFIINGKVRRGEIGFDDFREMVEQELRQSAVKPK